MSDYMMSSTGYDPGPTGGQTDMLASMEGSGAQVGYLSAAWIADLESQAITTDVSTDGNEPQTLTFRGGEVWDAYGEAHFPTSKLPRLTCG